MTMTKWVVFGALAFAACGGGDKAKLQKMKDAMCECKDRACTKKVEEDNKEWMTSLQDKYKSEADIPKDMVAIGDDMEKCERAARKADDDGKNAADGKMYADAMAKMSGFKDKMCACKDKACADGVNADFQKMMTEMAVNAASFKPSGDDMKTAEEVSKAYSDCMAKATTPAP